MYNCELCKDRTHEWHILLALLLQQNIGVDHLRSQCRVGGECARGALHRVPFGVARAQHAVAAVPRMQRRLQTPGPHWGAGVRSRANSAPRRRFSKFLSYKKENWICQRLVTQQKKERKKRSHKRVTSFPYLSTAFFQMMAKINVIPHARALSTHQ